MHPLLNRQCRCAVCDFLWLGNSVHSSNWLPIVKNIETHSSLVPSIHHISKFVNQKIQISHPKTHVCSNCWLLNSSIFPLPKARRSWTRTRCACCAWPVPAPAATAATALWATVPRCSAAPGPRCRGVTWRCAGNKIQ